MDRTDRNRQGDSGRSADAWMPGDPIAGHSRLVVVYDGGSIPTAGDKVFLTHPAVIDFDESEGESWATAEDSDVTLPVVVLGSTAPEAGDVLVAHAVGGRWVATVGADVTACSPCNIPNHDLTLTLPGGTTRTLVYLGTGFWRSACEASGPNSRRYLFRCFGLDVQDFFGAICGGAVTTTGLTLVDYTCSPFHAHFQQFGSFNYYVDE